MRRAEPDPSCGVSYFVDQHRDIEQADLGSYLTMTRLAIITAGLATCLLLSPAFGEEDGKKRRGQNIDRAQILKQFDANGDGRLDDAEKEKAKAAFLNRQKQGNRAGKGKAGQGRPGQKRPGQAGGQDRPNFQQLIKQFDKDGDGKLNEQERAALREQMSKARRGKAGGNNNDARRIPEQALKLFDKDGDGKLNEEERAAAMKAREERLKKNGNNGQARPSMKEILAKFDKDGDGKLSESERAEIAKFRQRGGADRPAAAKEKPGRVNKKELIKKFDADGDGELSDEERAAAREAFQNRNKD